MIMMLEDDARALLALLKSLYPMEQETIAMITNRMHEQHDIDDPTEALQHAEGFLEGSL